jgi:ATP-dependent exoDNAse (exonuclease V) alpha subunit
MRLVSTNEEVDTINSRELQRVCAETGATPKSFPIHMGKDPRKGDACRKAEGIPEFVELAIGAQIVVIHNISTTIVNGTQGVVAELRSDEVIIRTVNGSLVTIPYIALKDPDHPDIYTAKPLLQYLPVRLGFAGTIHKAQGMSLSLVDIDCRRVFCHGQMYVGISRCTSLRGLRLSNFTRKAVICDPIVRGFLGVEC